MDTLDEPRGAVQSEADNPQVQMLQDTWLLTLFAVLLATALPWFVSSFDVDFASASWRLLLLGIVYVGISAVANRGPAVSASRRRILIGLHSIAIVVLGLLWQRSGSLQNPVFLLAFVLPLIGAATLSRWQPYVSAALAVLVVSVVAIGEVPELRWHVGGLQNIARWIVGSLRGEALGGIHAAFPGFYAPVGYDVVLLEVFAILMFACASAAESLGNVLERLFEHLRSARTETANAQDLWTTLVQQLPTPALLVDAESLQVVLTSTSLAAFHSPDATLIGQGMLDAIRFSYPERVQQLVAGEGGVAKGVVVKTADGLRLVDVRVQHVHYEGRRLALTLLEDTTLGFALAAALDTDERAALVIDTAGRIVATNKLARVLFPEIEVGSDADRILSRTDGTQRWWEPGVIGRRRVHFTLASHSYVAACTAVSMPGENEGLYVVTLTLLLPAAAGVDRLAGAPR